MCIRDRDAADLLKEIQKQLKRRQWGEGIRLEVEDGIDKRLLKILKKAMNVGEASIYRINGPDRKSTRLNSSHSRASRMPSSA